MLTYVYVVLLFFAFTKAEDCSVTSVGFIPLKDMTTSDTYQGYAGFLYPGSNSPPANHLNSAMAEAAEITPLDSAGNPSSSGKIGFTSIGMSNTNQEFGKLITLSGADPNKRAEVVLMNGAQSGVPAENMVDITAQYWVTHIPGALSMAGLTDKQVQVAWLKQTNKSPTGPFPNWADNLKSQLIDILRNAKTIFPNLKIVYLSSRIYAGYASSNLNPEPYAYEQGFACKWVIDLQIDGDMTLNFDETQGLVKSGLLLWGPYLWADGLTPNNDGLTWVCPDDFTSDGTHPSDPIGRLKVGNILLDFLNTDQTTFWYRDSNSQESSTQATTSSLQSTTSSPQGTTDTALCCQQCYGYSGSGACLGDCECGGCQNDGCMPGNSQGPLYDTGACSGSWNYGSGCPTASTGETTASTTSVPTTTTSVPTSTTSVPTSTTSVPTSTTSVPTTTEDGTTNSQDPCSTWNGSPSGCTAACYCGYCPPLGCTEGDAIGPEVGQCTGGWQFFGPC